MEVYIYCTYTTNSKKVKLSTFTFLEFTFVVHRNVEY